MHTCFLCQRMYAVEQWVCTAILLRHQVVALVAFDLPGRDDRLRTRHPNTDEAAIWLQRGLASANMVR